MDERVPRPSVLTRSRDSPGSSPSAAPRPRPRPQRGGLLPELDVLSAGAGSLHSDPVWSRAEVIAGDSQSAPPGWSLTSGISQLEAPLPKCK